MNFLLKSVRFNLGHSNDKASQKTQNKLATTPAFHIYIKFPFSFFLLLSLTAYSNHAFAQSTSTLPAFYPIAEHTYDIKDGLPDLFVQNVLLDKTGRLHMNKGGGGTTAFGKSYYEYDGTRTYPAGLGIKNPRFLRMLLEGKDSSGRFYGFINYLEGNGNDKTYSVFILYDPLTRTTRNVEVDGMVRQVVLSEGVIYTVVLTKGGQHDIMRISDGEATVVASLEMPSSPFGNNVARLAITDQDFWVGSSPHAISRISRKDGTVKHYAMPNEDRWIYSILTSPNQDEWITATLSNPAWSDKASFAVYLWNHETDSFTTNPHKPAAWADDELTYAMAFKDAKGNILVSYRNKKKESSATLVDAQQQRFDYTSVMSGHELVSGDDFKKALFFTHPACGLWRWHCAAPSLNIRRMTGGLYGAGAEPLWQSSTSSMHQKGWNVGLFSSGKWLSWTPRPF